MNLRATLGSSITDGKVQRLGASLPLRLPTRCARCRALSCSLCLRPWWRGERFRRMHRGWQEGRIRGGNGTVPYEVLHHEEHIKKHGHEAKAKLDGVTADLAPIRCARRI
eukprot:scaffold44312_cov37-Tisochrysis_lutea.AAC.3